MTFTAQWLQNGLVFTPITSDGTATTAGATDHVAYMVGDGSTTMGNGYSGSATEIEIPSYYNNKSVTKIGQRAFRGKTDIASVTISNTVTTLDSGAFYGCSGLISIRIPDSVTIMGTQVFQYCTGLKSVTIGKGVIGISTYAFSGCSSLESITIPSSVTDINAHAFSYCSGLTSITIPSSVSDIDARAFSYCGELSSITANSGNKKYHSSGNCLIETVSKTVILGCKNSIIPTDGSVTSIGIYAFMGCVGLTSITIPNSVTSIAAGAFSSCSKLTTIKISTTTPPTLGASAIPSNVTTIQVPSANVNAYKAASGWSSYASKIVGF